MGTSYVTCRDITGQTRDQLTVLCQVAKGRPGEPVSEEQKEAARLLLAACAAFIDARVSVPKDIRVAILELLDRGDELDLSPSEVDRAALGDRS